MIDSRSVIPPNMCRNTSFWIFFFTIWTPIHSFRTKPFLIYLNIFHDLYIMKATIFNRSCSTKKWSVQVSNLLLWFFRPAQWPHLPTLRIKTCYHFYTTEGIRTHISSSLAHYRLCYRQGSNLDFPCAGGRIRTYSVQRQQIYSLPRLSHCAAPAYLPRIHISQILFYLG